MSDQHDDEFRADASGVDDAADTVDVPADTPAEAETAGLLTEQSADETAEPLRPTGPLRPTRVLSRLSPTKPPSSPAAEAPGAEAGDPLEEFRASLRSRIGDWYVVHRSLGHGDRVKSNLENRITSPTWRTSSSRSSC